ncbi:MAG: alpha-1,4 polygalactosaminidase, partial [Cloacibacterium sp.]
MADIENINVLSSSSNNDNWNPEYGEETEKLLSKFFGNDIEAKEKVKEETYHIMQLCGNPERETNEDTGLVFGYVQSGKTLSFTTLTALARDNNYQIVIILAGISTNLVNQSYSRLLNDLNINKGGIQRKWVLLNNPTDPIKNPQDKNTIKRELANWKKPNTPSHFKKTLLITVMKNTSHLKNLLSVLRQLDLSKVPTLIIDDEGDQASMNTKASANARNAKTDGIHTELEMSTIYGRIRNLKAVLPHHTFIQYTATPQAPLFINILDNLSPNFIQLLTPGAKYTGCISFCLENHCIVRYIPYSQVYSD